MIAATDITVTLKGRRVLDGASISVEAGQLTAIVGPNGAGKSTLAKVLAGLIEPQQGEVALDGRMLRSIPLADRARILAYLPQEREVHWPLPARAIVALGRLPYGRGGASLTANDHAAVDTALAAVDATQLADRAILELSGGERARILIARALAQMPRVLIADEPSAGLDPGHQLQLFQHLGRAAAGGMAVIVALHDLSLAARFADRVVLLDAGQIAASGPPRDVLKPYILGRVYAVRMTDAVVDGIPVVLPVELLA